MSSSPPVLPFRWLLCAALALALGHALLSVRAARSESTTMDELAHVTGGYTFNHWNDYRLHPENGNLAQRWQALPSTLAGVTYPPFERRGWRESVVWLVGYDYFYRSGNDPDRLLAWARAMNACWGAATVLLVVFWARRLWGDAGGLVAGGFAMLCPTLLAHSALATSDMCMAFFLLVVPAAYWWHLHDGGWRAWAVTAGLLGLAAVAKFTAVLLLPILGSLAVWRLLQPAPLQLGRWTFRTPGARGAGILVSTVAQGLVAVAIIWLFFGFRYSMFNPALPPGSPNLPWPVVLAFGGWKAEVIRTCADWRLLPEGWLYGFAFVLEHAQARAAFLDGDYSVLGWMDFFPRSFLYKTPPATLVAGVAGLLLLLLQARSLTREQLGRALGRAAPLLAVFVVYWLFSITSHLNIGHRHILPTYPVLYIGCGVLGWAAMRARARARTTGNLALLLVGGLLAAQAVETVRIHPHYLAYFSPAVGGPAEGYHHLVDSSLDWGQDLPALQTWLKANRRPGEPVYVSYFGSDEPHRFVPDATLLPRLPVFELPRPWYWCEPGIYAISATMLQHVYFPDLARWGADSEQRYRELARIDPQFRALAGSPEKAPPELLRDLTMADWQHAWKTFEQLRFARLCLHLRTREPDATAGYSILIYRLDAAELAAALGPPRPPAPPGPPQG